MSLGKLKPYISISIVNGNVLEPGSSFIVLFGVICVREKISLSCVGPQLSVAPFHENKVTVAGS